MTTIEKVVKAKRWNWMVYVGIGFMVIAIILLIVSLATKGWIEANVTTTPDDYLGYTDIDQDIGLFRTDTEQCCLGQYRYTTGLYHCGSPTCSNQNDKVTADYICDFAGTMNYLNRVSFDCQKFKDGVYTTIVFMFFSLFLAIAAVAVAILKFTTKTFPILCGITCLVTVIPLCVFPLVSYKEVRDLYNDRFPRVLVGPPYQNIFKLNTQLGPSYLVFVFSFICMILALLFAIGGAWRARKDQKTAANRFHGGYVDNVGAPRPVNYPPPVIYSSPIQPKPQPPMIHEAPSVEVYENQLPPSNPILTTYQQPRPSAFLTKQNVEYNDFVHRTDGTFA